MEFRFFLDNGKNNEKDISFPDFKPKAQEDLISFHLPGLRLSLQSFFIHNKQFENPEPQLTLIFCLAKGCPHHGSC